MPLATSGRSREARRRLRTRRSVAVEVRVSDQKRLRVAVIGAGGITPLRHVPAFRTVPGVEVVGVIDTHADRAASVAARCRLAYHGTSLDQPWFEAVDAVSVAVPPLQHFPVVSACLERGKHVLLEKPFTVDAADAERLTADADGRRLVLAMVHNLLFSRGINRLRALRDAGALGDMLGFHVHQTSTAERLFPPWRDQLPFGLFFDESPHPLYLLRDIGGEVTFDGAMTTRCPHRPQHAGRRDRASHCRRQASDSCSADSRPLCPNGTSSSTGRVRWPRSTSSATSWW